ncbi:MULTISPECIES: OmpA family protein [Rodentibacter]|uniref:OmpA family protein n=1 Tax=Rodentibacter TaxID=1960084 RepID=UPI001CFEF9FB|nr:OmpA family protein [Rodentibacter sp. JRC1]
MKKTLLGLTVAFVFTGCARNIDQPLEVWSNFEQSKVPTQLGKNQALAVFYRQDDVQGPAVNVYVDGNYQASLLPNAFTPITVCANKHLFTTSFTTNSQFGNRTQGITHTLPINEITYIKVSQQNNKLTFERVESAVGSEAVSKLPKENQTLSRVPSPRNCSPAVLTVEALDASALFAFNKFGYKDILPKGKAKIQEFAEKAKTLPAINEIQVSGHTDPVGSNRYNKALSQKRAETVKNALQKSGVTAPISAVGYGEAEPVVSNCEHYKGAARNQCNQANRRVEIAVYVD